MYIRDAAFAAANLTALYAPYLSKNTEIILPSDAAWNTSVEQRWTVFAPPTYLGAIKPATEQDVATIVCPGSLVPSPEFVYFLLN